MNRSNLNVVKNVTNKQTCRRVMACCTADRNKYETI